MGSNLRYLFEKVIEIFCWKFKSNALLVTFKGVVKYDFTFLTLVCVKCCCLSINNTIKVTTLKVQSKEGYLLLKKSFFKDYNKWLVGTTQGSSRVSDITNPKMYINPSPGIHSPC